MKKAIFIVCILLSIILLMPMPMHLKDGGTAVYKAVLYQVEDVHRMNPDDSSDYLEGTVVSVLGMEIYNDVE